MKIELPSPQAAQAAAEHALKFADPDDPRSQSACYDLRLQQTITMGESKQEAQRARQNLPTV